MFRVLKKKPGRVAPVKVLQWMEIQPGSDQLPLTYCTFMEMVPFEAAAAVRVTAMS
jgi:hypothetical protein